MYTKILPCILKLKADKLIQTGLMLPLQQQILLEEFSLLVFLTKKAVLSSNCLYAKDVAGAVMFLAVLTACSNLAQGLLL